VSGRRYGLEIRAAQGTDAAGLAELLAACGQPVEPRRLAARIEAVQSAPAAFLLALEWGPPSGVVALHWTPVLDQDQPAAIIDTLLVGPEERRRGIGRLLVKAAAQAARTAGCGTLLLAAPEDAAGLEAFCLATGFSRQGSLLARSLRKRS